MSSDTWTKMTCNNCYIWYSPDMLYTRTINHKNSLFCISWGYTFSWLTLNTVWLLIKTSRWSHASKYSSCLPRITSIHECKYKFTVSFNKYNYVLVSEYFIRQAIGEHSEVTYSVWTYFMYFLAMNHVSVWFCCVQNDFHSFSIWCPVSLSLKPGISQTGGGQQSHKAKTEAYQISVKWNRIWAVSHTATCKLLSFSLWPHEQTAVCFHNWAKLLYQPSDKRT